MRLTLIIWPRMYFGAILCKKARQPRVYKAFGGRRHTEGRCSSIDENGKSRHSVWLSDDVWQEVDAFYKLDNCPIRNEFVEKALRQYCGRLHAERTGAYLPRALQGVMEGTLGVFGERLGRLLLKLAVEHNMTNHLLGGDMDMTRDEYSKMRGSSVREVSATHGTISFKDVLLFYKEDWPTQNLRRSKQRETRELIDNFPLTLNFGGGYLDCSVVCMLANKKQRS